MSLFLWIVIGASSLVLLMLVIVLIAEIGNNLRITKVRKEAAVTKKRRKEERAKPSPRPEARKPEPQRMEAAPLVVELPEEQEVPVPPLTEEIPSIVEETMPSAPDELAVEIPEPETFELLEAEEIIEEPGIGEALPEAVAPGEWEAEHPVEAEFVPTPYPEFSNARAVEQLGLSQEEADLFMPELVAQIEEELPNLEAAIAANDVVQVERVSHMLKGSSTNLGSGGVSDVLVAFNTYCKTGSDFEVIQNHMQNLRFYLGRLKAQFGIQ